MKKSKKRPRKATTPSKRAPLPLPLEGRERDEETGLRNNHKLFVEKYFYDHNCQNATKAAIDAGFKSHSARIHASKLLTRPDIKAYLKQLQDEFTRTAGISKLQWLKEQKLIGFSDITDCLSFGPDGVTVKDSGEIAKEALRAISEVSETVTAQGGTVKIKLHDKQRALDAIGRHFGWLKEKPCEPGAGLKIENSNVIVLPAGASEEEWQKLIQERTGESR